MIEEDLWIEAIQEELKDISKIKLSECSLLLQEFVTCCLQSESGMYFFEVDSSTDCAVTCYQSLPYYFE